MFVLHSLLGNLQPRYCIVLGQVLRCSVTHALLPQLPSALSEFTCQNAYSLSLCTPIQHLASGDAFDQVYLGSARVAPIMATFRGLAIFGGYVLCE
jgi:hypothetical protein